MNFKKISRRDFLLKTSIGLGTSIAGASITTPLFATAKSIKVGVLAPSHCALPIIFADISNIYKKYGLKVEPVYKKSMPELIKGINKGELLFGQVISTLILAANAGIGPFKGKPVNLISSMLTGINGGILITGKNSGIKLPQNLKGKTIGIHSKFMPHYLVMLEMLNKYKLKPEKDVTIKVIHMGKILDNLKNGTIDAFINPEPLSSVAVAKNIGVDFMRSKDLWFQHPCCAMASKKKLFKTEPKLYKNFILATSESALLLNKPFNRKEKLKTVWDNSKQFQKVPFEILNKACTPGRADFYPFPYQSSMQLYLKLFIKRGLAPSTLSPVNIAKQTFLSDYSREILKELKASQIPQNNNRIEKIIGS